MSVVDFAAVRSFPEIWDHGDFSRGQMRWHGHGVLLVALAPW